MEKTIAKIVSVQIGKIKTIQDDSFTQKQWSTGSYKESIGDTIHIKTLGVQGDEISDKIHHGGINKAVFANSYENYPTWCEFLGVSSLEFGALAENLTISTIEEKDVCIGDIHKIGTTILEVSQPREPCWKISKKHNNENFKKHIYDTCKTGWYYRVLQEGDINKNDEVILIKRLDNAINIIQANKARHDVIKYKQIALQLINLDVLSDAFRKNLKKKYEVENAK